MIGSIEFSTSRGEEIGVAAQRLDLLHLVGEFAIGVAQPGDDELLFTRHRGMGRLRFAHAHQLGDVLDAMQDRADAAVGSQDRRVDRIPIALLEAAAFGIGFADVVFLDAHHVGPAQFEDTAERRPQIGDAVGARVVRIVGKHLEHMPAEDVLAAGHRGAAIGVVHRADRERGIEHQIQTRRLGEERTEILVICGHVVVHFAGSHARMIGIDSVEILTRFTKR